MDIGSKICVRLAERIASNLVDRIRCQRIGKRGVFVVDFIRGDSADIMYSRMYERLAVHYTGSVYYENETDKLVGDLPVPNSKEREKINDISRVDCTITDIHRAHRPLGVTHIHFECPNASKRLEELIKILTE